MSTGGITLTVPSFDLGKRSKGYLDAISLSGENFPWILASSQQALTTQRVTFSPVFLKAGETVTNIYYMCTTAASGVTTIKYGIYSTAGTKLAASANSTSALAAIGLRSVAMATPYTPSVDGVVLFAQLMVASGAGNMALIPSSGTAHNSMNSTTLGAIQAGQSDLPSPATFDTSTTGGTVYWYGWT